MIKTFIAAGAAGALVTATALAGADFDALDADGSGGLSFDEIRIAAPGLTLEEFASYDADASGELSLGEFEQWAAAPRDPAER